MSITYLTLEGKLLDLACLTDDQREYLEAIAARFRDGAPRSEIVASRYSPNNPLLPPGQRVHSDVVAHPLMRALRDMADRAGIAQGVFKPAEGDDPGSDPFADELRNVAEVAAAKDVTRAAVYQAIERGDLVATRTGRPQRVSARSVERWTVDKVRQAARQTG